jgi:hypothetical protein
VKKRRSTKDEVRNKKPDNAWVKKLSSHLFWDVDKNKLDPENDPEMIVQRVLEYGLLKDWQLLKKNYGMDKIKDVAVQLRTLDDLSISFISFLCNLKKKDFRCYRLRQSNPHCWNY